jgi:hypothetical protein
MADMTESKGSRAAAIFSMMGAWVAASCLAFDVYTIVTGHPTGVRLSWDIAYLPVYGGGAFVFVMRYRQFSARSRTTKTPD